MSARIGGPMPGGGYLCMDGTQTTPPPYNGFRVVPPQPILPAPQPVCGRGHALAPNADVYRGDRAEGPTMPMLMPPAQYDRPPQMPVIEKVLPWNELQQLCRARERPIYNGTGYGVWGCAIVKDGKCYMARLDVPGVRRHELAHCNGWPKDHPGGWYDAPLHEH